MEKKRHFDVNKIDRTCSFCGQVFYAKKNTAIYCSDSCKQRAYQLRIENRDGYQGDLNPGMKLLPGTITSQGMPESAFVFSCDFNELKKHLIENYMTEEHLISEMQYLKKLEPICETLDWIESSCQIFADTYLLEIIMINPGRYKLYAQKWESPDENPLPFKS